MIRVIYYRDHNRVTMEGHATAAPKGEDLVCAGATILARTLAANVEYLCACGAASAPVIKLSEGSAEIACKANHKHRNTVRRTFETVCVGFEILAQLKDFVSYEIRG